MTAWNYESTRTRWTSGQSREKRRDLIEEKEDGAGEALLEEDSP